MPNPLRTPLAALLDESKTFSFDHFTVASNFAEVTPSAWIRWFTRVSNTIEKNFKAESAPAVLAKRGIMMARTVEGNGEDHFEEAKENLTGALREALAAVDHDSYGELAGNAAAPPSPFDLRQVFVVHGRDDAAKTELEVFLQELGLEPIVLHRRPDEGRTLIEKFEHLSNVGFAVVLLTPDDSTISNGVEERRARQNVVFELGFFYGRLGRNRVCCVYKKGTALPTDISGIVYKEFQSSISEVKYELLRELKAAGLSVAV